VQHGHGIAIVPERRFPPEGVFKVKRVPLGPMRHQRTLGIVEPVGSPKRRLTDVLFNELTGIVGGQQKPKRKPRRKH
jgi:hypothetical protein